MLNANSWALVHESRGSDSNMHYVFGLIDVDILCKILLSCESACIAEPNYTPKTQNIGLVLSKIIM